MCIYVYVCTYKKNAKYPVILQSQKEISQRVVFHFPVLSPSTSSYRYTSVSSSTFSHKSTSVPCTLTLGHTGSTQTWILKSVVYFLTGKKMENSKHFCWLLVFPHSSIERLLSGYRTKSLSLVQSVQCQRWKVTISFVPSNFLCSYLSINCLQCTLLQSFSSAILLNGRKSSVIFFSVQL
jgi:hypothetical protein